MATVPRHPRTRRIEYPTSDGKPMAETEIHRDDMIDLIRTLDHHFADVPLLCVSGNMLMFYEEGIRRKHVSPDVFVVRGVAKKRRDNYLIWEEGKAPDAIIELTSKSTKQEDLVTKRELYRDVLHVREYFMFDPTQDYLKPPLLGLRLVNDEYIAIDPVDGRLPSEVLGLHLEQDGTELRLYDPERRAWLPKPQEREKAAEQRAETESTINRKLAAEIEELKQQLEALRRGTPPSS